MYNTGPEKPPKRPVVSSLTGAMTELGNWLRDNQFEELTDGDGLVWRLDMRVTQIPAKDDPKGLLWQIQIGLRCDLDGEGLIRAGVLQRPDDERLLGLLGEAPVPLTMKPQVHLASNEVEAKRLVAEVLPRFKGELAAKSLLDVKRVLVGRWVDQRCRFGGGQVGDV